MTDYTIFRTNAGIIQTIKRDDGVFIPVCEDNCDYIQYLADVETHGEYPVEVLPVIEPSNQPTNDELQDMITTMNAIIMDLYLGV